jgi:hypothetical protein
MITRALIAGAMLLLASTPSQPETVNQYITDTGNPNLKDSMEAYAIGVGHGFFWYNQAMMEAVNREPTGQGRLFCLPPNTNFSGKIVLEAAQRVTETAKGEDIFERELLSTLIKMFPCESRPELK